MTDLALTIAHHLLVFGLAAILAAELASLRPGLTGAGLRRPGVLAMHYGFVPALLLIVGFARVYWGAKGPEAFLGNWAFWSKVGVFAGVGLLSIPPTLRILHWRRRARGEPDFALPAGEVALIRRFMIAEAVLFAFIPFLAAMMVRGFGQ